MEKNVVFSQSLIPVVVMCSNRMIEKYFELLDSFLKEKGFVLEDKDVSTSKFFTYYKYEGINSNETFDTLKMGIKKIVKEASFEEDKYNDRECVQISIFPE